MISLSIVIVNWNVKQLLEDCLNSIFRTLDNLDFEVIVVDNNSSDGSAEMIKGKFPSVILIENKENLGFGAANNQGIRISKGEYVLILNPDTIIFPNALKSLIAFLDQNPKIGAVCPKILNSDNTVQLSCIRKLPTLLSEFFELTYLNRRFPKNRIIGDHYMSYCDYNLEREVELLSGCCIMIRKIALEKIGLFDENFFIYGEDMDLCHRIKKAGWKLWYLPPAQIMHFGGESTKQVSDKRIFYSQEAKYAFFKKHFGTGKAFLYCLVAFFAVICVYLGYVFLYPLSSKQNKIKLKNLLSQNHRILKWVLRKN